jgi:phenylalanine ammonia-lyase
MGNGHQNGWLSGEGQSVQRTALAETVEAEAPVAPEACTIDGRGLTIAEIARVASGAEVRLSEKEAVRDRIRQSADFIARAVEEGTPIYGVTTCFGGMADRVIPKSIGAELQMNLIWSHKAGTGAYLPVADVRAAMLLRANSLTHGVSGIRLELIQRFETFLNAGVTPLVHEFGSIGASGDLIPLAYIAGALTGVDRKYRVNFDGEEVDCVTAIKQLGLAPLPLLPKEGLALINGTSVMTGIAANAVHRARHMLAVSMGAHSLMIQALNGSHQSFLPFIHARKPHPGQLWAASQILDLLHGSRLTHQHHNGRQDHLEGKLIQDRYSIRCLPQFIGPIADGIEQIARQIEVEANSVTDNPLIDVENGVVYHCGNFLGQYIGVAMDQLRYHLGMLAKHLDTQIALLVAPEFNHGLPPSLVGNPAREINVGLKPLQLTANSIMPMLSFYGNSLADRFPTHAEQFNQNINSMGFGSANLARRSLEIFEQYAAVALLFAVQAVDLRTYVMEGHYDARRTLSPASLRLYEAVRHAAGRPASPARPFLWNDNEQFLDGTISRVTAALGSDDEILTSLNGTLRSMEGCARPIVQ